MTEHVAVEVLPNLPHVVAVLVEFEICVCWAQVLTKICPFELRATPMPSPIYTLGGNFMKSFTTSTLISGALMALGRSFNWAGVRPPGGAWAPPAGGWRRRDRWLGAAEC